jgi:hypothetical protein
VVFNGVSVSTKGPGFALEGRESEKDNKAKTQLRPTLHLADGAEAIETVMRAAEACSVTQPS